jgi:hypothetical protein
MVNCPDSSTLRVEMIQKGKYKMAIFKGQQGRPRGSTEPRRGIRWHDKECEDEGEVCIEFDWSKPDHIHQLNDWRQQFIRRQSATAVKPPSIPYHQLEEDFCGRGMPSIWRKKPVMAEFIRAAGDSYLSRARKQQWADAFK